MGKQQRSCQHHWFQKFTWLHYDIETDSVLCFLCVRAEKKGYVTGELSKEQAYISKGFKSWKKAPKCFTEHEQSKTKKTAKTYEVLVPRCADVGNMLSDNLKSKRLEQRKYFIKVMECVQYLARQGISFLESNDNNDNFFQLLLLMGNYDKTILDRIEDTSVKWKHKFTDADYQLELLTLMSNQVLRTILIPIKENGIYSLMSNEWTDIANLEELSICVRTVNDNLEVSECFLGFYEIPNIRSEIIVTTIKDALTRMQLPLSSCPGQTYNGASNMLGKKSGVAKKILNEVPKALPAHCHAHSLSLFIKSTSQNVKILNDVMLACLSNIHQREKICLVRSSRT